MASIKKYDTAKGTAWRVQYRSPDGKSRTKQGFRTKTEAQQWADKNATTITEGSWINPQHGKITVSELATLWWAGRQHLKTSTLDRDRPIRARVVEQWGGWQVGAIRTSNIQTWVSGMGKSGSTVRNVHNVLSQILDVAVADGLILTNPAHGVKLPRKSAPVKVFLTPKQLSTLTPKQLSTLTPKQLSTLTPKQLSTLATAAGDTRRDRVAIVWVLGTVGLRWGELAGLKVEDIDFDRARITV
ncbi:Arm DNA-binding domain-containing protein [Corynebacterium ulcerans]|uniref:Arm DNA-binding domain-containing protein n=1 Tax=Corynebacterium ulcerans TaxID=65058 RepID=UPI000DA3818C|nr:Arm DNA-binding domain-containing protein [Corynebacterium ulcerans]SQH03465.1 Integrase [Corynebacterium ulcerans]